MPIKSFPNPLSAGEDGLVAIGGDLHSDSLLLAYRGGIFPWPMEGYPLLWFFPFKRAVLFFDDLKVPKSLQKKLKKRDFQVTFNQAFEKVIQACADTLRKNQDATAKTWITSEMIKAYKDFHHLGFAHSVEVWREKKLIGGLYGVLVENIFAGESMFHLESDASKIALISLISKLKEKGIEWMDIQQLTPHMEKLGAKEIPRQDFLGLMKKTKMRFKDLVVKIN